MSDLIPLYISSKEMFGINRRLLVMCTGRKIEDRPERVNIWPDSAVLAFASYSMTSSARASSDGGTVMPALAVLILTTISNLVGACTGRSEASRPLR